MLRTPCHEFYYRYQNCPALWFLSGSVPQLLAILLYLVVSTSPIGRGLDSGRGPRVFTVKDSIEISHIVNSPAWDVDQYPPIGPVFSPDRKYFFLITQKGEFDTNSIQSTIWLFEEELVLKYLSNPALQQPAPKALVTMTASSNLPVISDARWMADSSRITFLGKNNSPYQQLFIFDLTTEHSNAITRDDLYVSAYDIRDSTLAYTTLTIPQLVDARNVEDMVGKSIYSLLFPNPWHLEDLADTDLWACPNTLHIERGGHEVPLSLTMDGKPLHLFLPTLSLSVDQKTLITLAPVQKIPPKWAGYRPAFDAEAFRLRPTNKWAVSEDNTWKAVTYVVIDLETGHLSPLLDAPLARSLLFFNMPTKVIWSTDGHRVLLSNTFLPLDYTRNEAERTERSKAPAIAIVDIINHDIQPITYQRNIDLKEKVSAHVSDIRWSETRDEVYLYYVSDPDSKPLSIYKTFHLNSGTAPQVHNIETCGESADAFEVWVHQSLNQPPIVLGHLCGSARNSPLWDPNTQLLGIDQGRAAVYKWHDKGGNLWSGILVLPPKYRPGVRYPLVIQTHGYSPEEYFADGEFTTGSGGRALAAKGIIVLQMDMPMKHFRSIQDGPFETGGLESAIAQLTVNGMVDQSRVGVVGFSYTCFHVLYALTHRPKLFSAATITDGNNMSYMSYVLSADAGSGLQELSEATNGGRPFGNGLLSWARAAPGFNLDKVQAPLLIMSLERGDLLAQWEIYGGLRILNKPVDAMWLRRMNAPHNLIKPADRYISQQGTVDWFDFWLNGHADTDPSKAEQYARWNRLRPLLTKKRRSQSGAN